MDGDEAPKGKGKAEAGKSQEEGPSLGGRIAESAKGLLENALRPNSDAVSTLSTSTTLGSKIGATNSSNASANLAAGPSSGLASDEVKHGSAPDVRMHVESFRTKESDDRAEQDFADFSSSQRLDLEQNLRDTEIGPIVASQKAQTEFPDTSNLPLHQHIQYDDGAEVRALLADPSFGANIDTPPVSFSDAPEPDINDLFPQNFSAEEQIAITRLRKELPPPPVYRALDSSHPLALVPRPDTDNQAIEQNIQGILDGTFTDQHLSSEAAAKTDEDEWLSNWIDVLRSYTDEVWGDMLPIVQETRAQLEQTKAGATSLDTKAVARLKMILGHLELNR